jgi:hypothetical protein
MLVLTLMLMLMLSACFQSHGSSLLLKFSVTQAPAIRRSAAAISS